METKSFNLEIKATGDGLVTAYAAAFNNVDSYGDVIRPGAFAKTIRERKDRIKVLYNHRSYDLPIGKPQTMEEDTRGLLTVTKMSGTQQGQDVYTLIGEGAINECSIGYTPIQAGYITENETQLRELRELKLFEYSFVNFPANEDAIITGIKSLADLEREIKRWHAIAEVNLAAKAGRTLSGANARRVLAALNELRDLLAEAGIEEEAADEGTSDTTSDSEKTRGEPRKHSALDQLLSFKTGLEREEEKGSALSELRSFAQTLKEG